MTAKEWLGVMQQASDYNPKMTNLIEKYGEMLIDEYKSTNKTSKEVPSIEEYSKAKEIVIAYEKHESDLFQEKLNEFKKDLELYFKENKVSGHYIKEFNLRDDYRNRNFSIVPTTPPLEECYEGENNEDIKNIADKHGIEASFVYWMYHK
jgi:hypothetical protein